MRRLLAGLLATACLATPALAQLGPSPTQTVTNTGTFPVQNTASTPAGTNNIGTVGAQTNFVSVPLPVGTATLTNVASISGSVTFDFRIIGSLGTTYWPSVTYDGGSSYFNPICVRIDNSSPGTLVFGSTTAAPSPSNLRCTVTGPATIAISLTATTTTAATLELTSTSAADSPLFTYVTPATGSSFTEVRQAIATTTRTNGTITTANIFQSVLASSTTRKDCFITNTSANAETIDLGASPAAATARPLPAGSTFECAGLNGVDQEQINLTSATAGSTWVVWAQ